MKARFLFLLITIALHLRPIEAFCSVRIEKRPVSRSATNRVLSYSANGPQLPTTTSNRSTSSTSSLPHLVVLIPAYNEEFRISDTLRSYREYLDTLPAAGTTSEILVVDDGSQDQTCLVVQQVANEPTTTSFVTIDCISLSKNQGKGAALAYGIQEIARRQRQRQQQQAATDVQTLVLTTDADGSAPATGIRDMINKLTEYHGMRDSEVDWGSPVVVAGLRTYDSAAPKRLVFRWGFRTVVKMVCGDLGVTDSQCGFKLFPLSTALELYQDLNLKGWSHDVEVLYRAKLLKIPVVETETEWEDKDGSKLVASPGGVLAVCARMFSEVLRLRWGYETGAWKLPIGKL